jgi:hypothetical protein
MKGNQKMYRNCMSSLPVSLILILLFFAPVALNAQGSQFRAGDVYRLAQGDSVAGQIIAAGEWIEIAGYAGNDVYAAGSSITIDGNIADDAIVAGSTVTLQGTVGDMLMSASESLLMDGSVSGDLFAAGDVLRLTENGLVSGMLFLAGNDVQIEGAIVNGRTRIAANTVRLDGEFRDHVVIYSNDVVFGPDYNPLGDTKVVSSRELYRENMGTIPENLILEIQKPSAFPVFMMQLWIYLSMLLTGAVMIYLFKPVTADLYRFSTERFWKNTGIGFLLVILTPISLVLLMFPLITIPLSILIFWLFVISLYLSYLAVAMMLGMQVLGWFRSESAESAYYWSLALGLLIIAALNNVPFIGAVFSILLLFFGTGSFWAYAVKRYYEPANRDV